MRILFFSLLMFVNTALFTQWGDTPSPDVPLQIGVDSDVWGSGSVLHNANTVIRRLSEGVEVLGEIAAVHGEIAQSLDYVSFIRYNNNRYLIPTSNLVPVGDGRLPDDWITASNAERVWIISYCLDVLCSQDRDTLFGYEEPWIIWQKENLRRFAEIDDGDYRWYSREVNSVIYESLVFFNAVIIIGGFARSEFFISEITQYSNGFKINMIGDRWFRVGRADSVPANRLPFPLYSERESFDMIFIPDGDFMDVYLDSVDSHFASFARVDTIVLEELERLIVTNTADLSRITSWPRRADGSTDYPPPDGAIRASHRTTDRLRVRENPDTGSAIVTTLDTGTGVQVLETGATETIGGITAPWVKVLAENGFTGWAFSGYLETLAPEQENLETQNLDLINANPANLKLENVETQNPETENQEQQNPESSFPVLMLAITGGVILVSGIAVAVVLAKRRNRNRTNA